MFLQEVFYCESVRERSVVVERYSVVVDFHLNLFARVGFVADGVVYELSECLFRNLKSLDSLESFVADVEDEVFAHQGFDDFLGHLDDVAFDFVLYDEV